ncbi:fluoride efflux transporter FluC [Aquihabitans daechungensis]|uniref:fluoride efflux transporter FluC n=1 Tax=Aquihabitans daechungensis TaxID=1052257 RepID=UPI003BA15886
MRFVLVGVAGAAGALCRYGIGVAVGERSFPWSTLAINIVGSFLLGLVLTVATARGWPVEVTAPVAVGFIGSFTTFSTFSWEALTLSRGDRVGAAAAYIAVSVVLGLLAAVLGLRMGQLAST